MTSHSDGDDGLEGIAELDSFCTGDGITAGSRGNDIFLPPEGGAAIYLAAKVPKGTNPSGKLGNADGMA